MLGVRGPAHSFTPVNLWDLRLEAGADLDLPLPEGHTAMLVVLSGQVRAEAQQAGEAEMLLLSRQGADIRLRAEGPAELLVMTGEPIDEPIVGYGPFVMNSEAEIRQAIEDVNSGRFGSMAA